MNASPAFCVWLTGLPASGKSSISRELTGLLEVRGIRHVVLESDVMRRILTPDPTYDREERDRFYRSLVLVGERIFTSGVPVIFDATANRRAYRDSARQLFTRFLEVFVQCPGDVCSTRDPKGIYAAAASGKASTVPGIQDAYEPPLAPEIVVDGRSKPKENAERIIQRLIERRYI